MCPPLAGCLNDDARHVRWKRAMLIKHLAILGVGLIGGSLARALRTAGVCARITGFGRGTDNLKRAVELGVIDDYTLDAGQAVSDADVVVLAAPLVACEHLLSVIKQNLRPGAVVTDVGSVKGSIVAAARNILSRDQVPSFVPGHPVAGTEKSGVEASFEGLFADHMVILTPVPETGKDQTDRIRNMWEETGARVVFMDVEHHDAILAATSHLPHMLAYALVDCLAGMQERDEIFRYAAGGFTDFTRIASSSPQMWNDICLANRNNLLQMLNRFDQHLKSIRAAIESDDSESLLDIFTRARNKRNEYIRLKTDNIETDE